MLTCFFDENGPLMLEWLETGGTVNANRFCDTLCKLKTAIKNHRRGLLSKGVILLQDNARPHVAKVCKDLTQHFRWEILHHPPYSPDLSPCDFHMFGPLKRALKGAGSKTMMRSEKPFKNGSARNPRLSSLTVSIVSWTNGTLVSTNKEIMCRQYVLHGYCLCTTLQFIIYTCI